MSSTLLIDLLLNVMHFSDLMPCVAYIYAWSDFFYQCAQTASIDMTFPREAACTSNVRCVHMNSAVAATTHSSTPMHRCLLVKFILTYKMCAYLKSVRKMSRQGNSRGSIIFFLLPFKSPSMVSLHLTPQARA